MKIKLRIEGRSNDVITNKCKEIIIDDMYRITIEDDDLYIMKIDWSHTQLKVVPVASNVIRLKK